jgi:hypothetical protein
VLADNVASLPMVFMMISDVVQTIADAIATWPNRSERSSPRPGTTSNLSPASLTKVSGSSSRVDPHMEGMARSTQARQSSDLNHRQLIHF